MKNLTDKNKSEFSEFRDNVLKGMKLAFEKLVAETAKNDGELVFSKDGKVVHVKAREFKK